MFRLTAVPRGWRVSAKQRWDNEAPLRPFIHVYASMKAAILSDGDEKNEDECFHQLSTELYEKIPVGQ